MVSVIASLLELRQFAQFIIGHRCDFINPILEKYGSKIGELDGDYLCFDVISTLQTGCWVLFSACAIYLTVGPYVIRKCHLAIQDRTQRAESQSTKINE